MDNSLSGNSISTTYQSVLQLDISTYGDGLIKDGLGNASVLQVGLSGGGIKVNGMEYPTSLSANKNKILLRDDKNNKLIFSDRLILNGDSIKIHEVDIPFKSTNGFKLIYVNNNKFDYVSHIFKQNKFINTPAGGITITYDENKNNYITNNDSIIKIWVINTSGNIAIIGHENDDNENQSIPSWYTGILTFSDKNQRLKVKSGSIEVHRYEYLEG